MEAMSLVTVRSASGEEEFEGTVRSNISRFVIVTLNAPPPPGVAFQVAQKLSVITGSGDRYDGRVLSFKESTNSLTILIDSPDRVLERLPPAESEIHVEGEPELRTGTSQLDMGMRRSGGSSSVPRTLNPAGPPPLDIDLEARHPVRKRSYLGILRVCGFCSSPSGGLLYVLLCLFAFGALGYVILGANLHYFHTGPVTALCAFLPLCCCAFPSVLLAALVSNAYGIRRFFNFPDDYDVGLPIAPWIIVLTGTSLVILFQGLYLTFSTAQNFIWRSIKFLFWTYFLLAHIISYALFLMRLILCKREISELEALLATVTGNLRERIDRLRQLEDTFDSLSQAISPYTCSQIFVIVVSVCSSLGIFYQKSYHHFDDKDHGAYYFTILSMVQAVTLWFLLGKCAGLNSGLKGLASVARRVNTDARMPEQGTVIDLVAPLEELQLIEHNVTNSRARISGFGWEVDVGMMIGVFGIHLTFVALTVGSFMSFLESKALK